MVQKPGATAAAVASEIPFNFGPNSWGEINHALDDSVRARRDQRRAVRRERKPVGAACYYFGRLEDQLRVILAPVLTEADGAQPALALVDRAKFGADVCMTVPALLKARGSKDYIALYVPRFVEALRSSDLVKSGALSKLEAKGIYVNLRIADAELYRGMRDLRELGERFGETDVLGGQEIVVDYSSPNAAKLLHAGHIRSTILGEVLSNLYEVAGALAHRVNHINDLGGFGFLLEGYRRWQDKLPQELSPNARLAVLYGWRRLFEKLSEGQSAWEQRSPEQDAEVARCFGTCESYGAFREHFADYVRRSDERFHQLEAGDREEVKLWQQMVRWSLDDFESFYELLNVKHDYVIGESFYSTDGRALVDYALQTGVGELVTPAAIERDTKRLQQALESKEIADEEYGKRLEALTQDLNARVIATGGFERCVVLRSDGATIYSTRDLGVMHYRGMTFTPKRSLYVVGKEQELHFKQVFEAGRRLGLAGGIELEHIYFGFYVDAKTKKKLSSRDGASNVNRLLRETIAYFDKKLADNPDIPEDERKRSAKILGSGSVVLNDIRKDRKTNVEMPAELEKAVEDFERAGGAYLMYTVCRANSIMRKAGVKPADVWSDLGETVLEDIEAELIKKVHDFPRRVATAALTDNPSFLVGHLLDSAQLYNTYYNAYKVIEDGKVVRHRLQLNYVVARMIEHGLRFCHIGCPERM